VSLFIKKLQPSYRQHAWFTPSENFTTLRKVGMLLEKELAREALAMTSSN